MSACMYIITMWAVPMKIIQLAHRKTFVRKNYLFFFLLLMPSSSSISYPSRNLQYILLSYCQKKKEMRFRFWAFHLLTAIFVGYT